jgi:hypothetical protein
MLSLESMEQRLDNPKAYYVFYEFFYKAAVGEVCWKDCLEDSDGKRIGNDTTEAFALLIVANNYKAWLYEEKMSHGEELKTEYDTGPSDGCISIVDKLLVNQEFFLERDADALVIEEVNSLPFKKAKKTRKDWLTKLRRQPICTDIKRSWEIPPANVLDERPTNSPSTTKKERDNKRRKLMKGLKKWTGNADDGERKFKGWSDNGHKAFACWTMDIKADVREGKYALWEKAFRHIQNREQEARQHRTTSVAKYTVDKNLVWEL